MLHHSERDAFDLKRLAVGRRGPGPRSGGNDGGWSERYSDGVSGGVIGDADIGHLVYELRPRRRPQAKAFQINRLGANGLAAEDLDLRLEDVGLPPDDVIRADVSGKCSATIIREPDCRNRSVSRRCLHNGVNGRAYHQDDNRQHQPELAPDDRQILADAWCVRVWLRVTFRVTRRDIAEVSRGRDIAARTVRYEFRHWSYLKKMLVIAATAPMVLITGPT